MSAYRPPRLGNVPIPRVTDREKFYLRRNFAIAVTEDTGMIGDSIAVAWKSAENSGKAARIYSAIARSYGVKT